MEATARSSTIDSEPRAASRSGARRTADAVLVLLFLAGLWVPLLGVHLGRHGWDLSTARAENRRMAAVPLALRMNDAHLTSRKAKLKAIAKLPGEFKYYLSDHFGFRSL